MTQNCETASSPDTACNRDCSLPSILYKYFSSARLDVLAERSVRFTQPGDFNDPFEFRPRIQAAAHEHEVRTHVENNFDRLIDQELNKYGALVPPELLDAVRAAAHDQKFLVPGLYRLLEPGVLEHASLAIDGFLNQSVGVLCLSEVRDSILMWGHYTDNHYGFVLGFDSKHSFFSKRRGDQDEFGFLRRVDYQRNRPNVILSDTSSPAWCQRKSDQWAYQKVSVRATTSVVDWLCVMKSWDERRNSHAGATATSWCSSDQAVGKRVC